MGDRYEIVKKLSEGGSGTVFLVWDTHLEKYRVMKEIVFFHEGQKKGALQEMAVLRRIQREGIPRLVDVITGDRGICLVMEYMQGLSLTDKVERQGKMGEKEAVCSMLGLGELLLFLHRQTPCVLHGDIKPGNVIWSEKGVSLLDFGGAKSYESGFYGEEGFFYTPGYAAPELEERGKITEQTDIYAFGCVMFFLVTGRQPYENGRGLCPVREENPYLSVALEKWIERCTHKNPGQRFCSMEQAMEELEKIKNKKRPGGKRRGFGGRRGMFQSVKHVLLTGQKEEHKEMRRSFLAGAAFVSVLAAGMTCLFGLAYEGEELPVNMRDGRGRKFLVDRKAEYHTEENPVFEIPIDCFHRGDRYQVTILQKDMESRRARTHTFVICAD